MREVVCWCCEYFNFFGNLETLDNNFIDGQCEYKGLGRFSEDAVCEEFILRSGLFTKRKIPDVCRNYKFNRRENNKEEI